MGGWECTGVERQLLRWDVLCTVSVYDMHLSSAQVNKLYDTLKMDMLWLTRSSSGCRWFEAQA